VRLSRTTLFVPASRPDMIPKAAASAADAVCIDLEDAVAPKEKAASRAHVVQALRTLDFGARTRIVRINGLDTPYAYRDLVEVIEAAGDRVDLVMVPKVGGARDVVFVDMLLTQIETHRALPAPIGVEAQIESAAGFVYLREIAAASPRLEALILGAGDYAASMKMPSSGIGEMDANDALYPGHRYHAGCTPSWRRRARTACAAWTGRTAPTRTPPATSAPAASPAPWGSTASSASIPAS
jgi:citrate lyase subunit beta/citryl-CoA lyase